MATLNLGRVGFVNKGTWLISTAYKINDTVIYNGGTYACLIANTGQTPILGGTIYWQEWVSEDTVHKSGTETITGQKTFSLSPIIPTPTNGDNTTKAASTAFVAAAIPYNINAATSKTTPVDADELAIIDSAASFGLKKLTWANLKATLKTYFDTLYPSISGKPAISVYLGSQQNITSATWTKVNFSTETYDTTNAFDSVTNFRFTPLVAGKYNISSCISLNGVGSTRAGIRIYKNGALHKLGNILDTPSTNNDQARTASADVDMNGTTDYIEIYAYINGTSTVIGAGLEYTYLTANFITGV